MSFADRWAATPKTSATEVSVLQRQLVSYRDQIYATALRRSRLDWDASGMATYGGLGAVAGALADRTGLMNASAGIAALGLTNSTRYKFQQQTQIYVAALKRLSCITGKVNATSDMEVNLAKGAADQAAANAANIFVDKVVAAVDYVRTEYTNGLLGITPSVPTRDELLAILNTYRVLPGAPAAPMAADPMQIARNQAGEVVLKLSADIQNCAKLP